MITFTAFKQMNSKALICSNLLYKLFQKEFHIFGKDLSAILHRPYHMVIDITHRSPIINEISFHTHSIPFLTL
jgi:hypothetical protein